MSDLILASLPSILSIITRRLTHSPRNLFQNMSLSRSQEVIAVDESPASCAGNILKGMKQGGKERRDKKKRQLPQDIEVIDLAFDDDDDYDSDIEVLPPPKPALVSFESTICVKPGISRKKSKISKNKNNQDINEEEIVEVGRTNIERFPHLRPHCTECHFIPNIKKSDKTSFLKNRNYCLLCYCYICDDVASSCNKWPQHCLAVDMGKDAAKWKNKRDKFKRDKERKILLGIPPSNTTIPNNLAPSATRNNLAPSATRNNLAPSATRNNLAPSATQNNLVPSATRNNLAPSTTLNNLVPSATSNNLDFSTTLNNLVPLRRSVRISRG